MKQLGTINDTVQRWKKFKRKVADLYEMINLTIEEGESSLHEEIQVEVEQIVAQLENMEIKLILNDEYDNRDAIIAIHAGAGGTESQDWAEMLLRMYLRWAEKHQYQAEIFSD